MKKKHFPMLKTTFWALIAAFLVILSASFVPRVKELFQGFPFVVWFIFFFLGLGLIFLTIKEKGKGSLRNFLLLTGVSASGFLVSVFLHNFFYALTIISRPIYVLSKLMGVFDVVFFFVATIVCPIGFVIGALGSMVKLIKDNSV